MRLIMNIQRIAPHQMVGVPQPTASQAPPAQAQPTQAPVAQAPPKQAPAASIAPVAPAPSRAPSRPPLRWSKLNRRSSSGCKRTSIDCARAVTSSSDCSSGSSKKAAQPVATVAPSIPIPEAFVPAFANANAAAKASVPPKEPKSVVQKPVRPKI